MVPAAITSGADPGSVGRAGTIDRKAGMIPAEEHDALVSSALADAARRVCPEPSDMSFLERRLAGTFATALGERIGRPDLVCRDKKLVNCELPGWNPQPGTIDVAIVTAAREPRVVFELKIDDVEWTLWDIYKMVSGTQLATVEAGYVVVAGRPALWNSSRDCVELFDLDYSDFGADSEQWDSRFLFREYRRAWAELLDGGRGRLTEVPLAISITAVGEWTVHAYPPYEIRAIRVEAAAKDEPCVNFAGAWPSPEVVVEEIDPAWGIRPIPSVSLTVGDLPRSDASEGDYHRFALSFNGYKQMGSFRRCARIANEAAEHWRANGELSTTLDELRACLFFEQRRWHHFGYGFDDAAFAYVRALVARLRQILEDSCSIEHELGKTSDNRPSR